MLSLQFQSASLFLSKDYVHSYFLNGMNKYPSASMKDSCEMQPDSDTRTNVATCTDCDVCSCDSEKDIISFEAKSTQTLNNDEFNKTKFVLYGVLEKAVQTDDFLLNKVEVHKINKKRMRPERSSKRLGEFKTECLQINKILKKDEASYI